MRSVRPVHHDASGPILKLLFLLRKLFQKRGGILFADNKILMNVSKA
jgi:hypothetical protein